MCLQVHNIICRSFRNRGANYISTEETIRKDFPQMHKDDVKWHIRLAITHVYGMIMVMVIGMISTWAQAVIGPGSSDNGHISVLLLTRSRECGDNSKWPYST